MLSSKPRWNGCGSSRPTVAAAGWPWAVVMPATSVVMATRRPRPTTRRARLAAMICDVCGRRGTRASPCRSDRPACSGRAATAVATWAPVATWCAVATTAAPAAAPARRPPARRKTRRPPRRSTRSGTIPLFPYDVLFTLLTIECSALASLQDHDSLATSPPSTHTSPMLSKSQPAVERRPSKTPSKDGTDAS